MTRGNGAFAVLNILTSIHNTVVARNDKSKFELKLQSHMRKPLLGFRSHHNRQRVLAATHRTETLFIQYLNTLTGDLNETLVGKVL